MLRSEIHCNSPARRKAILIDWMHVEVRVSGLLQFTIY